MSESAPRLGYCPCGFDNSESLQVFQDRNVLCTFRNRRVTCLELAHSGTLLVQDADDSAARIYIAVPH